MCACAHSCDGSRGWSKTPAVIRSWKRQGINSPLEPLEGVQP
jgi:hypothetical protein